MPEYAQKVAKRTGGADTARGLTRPTSHSTVSAPAGTDGGPAGTLQALLNEAPAVQAVTQMKGALNRRGSSLQVAQSKAAFDDAPVDVAQGRFETVQREQGVEEADCPPGLTGLDMVHASLNRAPLVEHTAQLRRSLNQSPRVAQLAVLSGAVVRSAVVQMRGVGGNPAFESGSGPACHGTLQSMLNASPRTLALAQLQESVSQSPRMVAQRQSVAGIFGAVRLKELDEKPAVQAKGKLDEKNPAPRSVDGTAQWKQDDKKKPAQGKMQAEAPPQLSAATETAQLKEALAPNRTCLPDNLKSGVESLSGISMDGVGVHRNSALPAQLNAPAYAQSHDVHLGPGQEQHLPHEARPVVQQTQGRLPPSRQMKGGVPVNDDKGLEHEANVMGSRAAQRRAGGAGSSVALRPATAGLVIQQKALVRDKLNVAGEYHPESGKRRDQEAAYTTEKTGGGYYKEGEFKTSKWAWQSDRLGDPMLLRAEMLLAILREKMVAQILTPFAANQVPPALGLNIPIEQAWDVVKGSLQSQLQEIATALYRALEEKTEVEQAVKAEPTFDGLRKLSGAMSLSVVKDVRSDILPEIKRIIARFAKDVLGLGDIRSESTVNQLRSKAMQEAAANNSARTIGEKKGVWKVGNDHIGEIKADKNTAKYELMTKDEFNEDFVPWVQLKYPEWFYTTFTVPAVKTAVQGLGAVLDKYPDSHWSVTPEDRQGALEGLAKLKDAWNGIKDEDRRSNAGIVITALDRYFMTVDRRRPSQAVMWEEKGFTKPPK